MLDQIFSKSITIFNPFSILQIAYLVSWSFVLYSGDRMLTHISNLTFNSIFSLNIIIRITTDLVKIVMHVSILSIPVNFDRSTTCKFDVRQSDK